MKHGILCIKLCFLLATPAFAEMTVNSEFVITNRVIESADFQSEAPGFSAKDTGSGLYMMSDNFSEVTGNADTILNRPNLNSVGTLRNKSTFTVQMTGRKLRHVFYVKGKYANSVLTVAPSSTNNQGVINTFANGFPRSGKCGENTSPLYAPGSVPEVGGFHSQEYTISSDSNVESDCKIHTNALIWDISGGHLGITGVRRDVYLDLGALQKDPQYRNAPPDIYTGTDRFNHDGVYAVIQRAEYAVGIPYNNKIKITKNPYFENVTLPTGDNIFTVKTVGDNVRGDLVIPYVINGHFTPYNTITLTVESLNGFKLKKSSGSTGIPYSLTTGIGSQKEYSLVTIGKEDNVPVAATATIT
ncbi:hypothetical protein GD488_25510, partial [Salmonella enterica]|nr:hypothetical protein [Salmonella enterica]